MPQPPADHIDLDTRLEEVDRGRVPKDMRTDVPPRVARTKLLRVTADELVDPEPSERDRVARGKDRMVWRRGRGRVRAKTAEPLSRLGPERACPPLVALTVEADAGRRLQIEIPPSEIHGLLHAGAGVIEEQQECAVPLGVMARSRQRREEVRWTVALMTLILGLSEPASAQKQGLQLRISWSRLLG